MPPKKRKSTATKRTRTKTRSELLPLKIRQKVRRSVSLIAACAPSKIHKAFERLPVFHPQIQTRTGRQRYGLNGRNQFVRRHLRNAYMRQLRDGNFVETRLLMNFGDLHSCPPKKAKHGNKTHWNEGFFEDSFLLTILSSAAGLSRKFCEGTYRCRLADFSMRWCLE